MVDKSLHANDDRTTVRRPDVLTTWLVATHDGRLGQRLDVLLGRALAVLNSVHVEAPAPNVAILLCEHLATTRASILRGNDGGTGARTINLQALLVDFAVAALHGVVRVVRMHTTRSTVLAGGCQLMCEVNFK